jgi:PHS family inorganic phosphate transporter-like MFS transporter
LEAGPDWFGYVIIIFAAFMFLGAVVTKYLIPETRKPDGSSRPLEDLQYVGRHYKRQNPRPESVSENPRDESHNVEANPDGIDMHVIES